MAATTSTARGGTMTTVPAIVPTLSPARPFRIDIPPSGGSRPSGLIESFHPDAVRRQLLSSAARPLERLLGIDQINEVYRKCCKSQAGHEAGADAWSFLDRALDLLNVRYRLPKADFDRIPRSGPLVVVANHPFGALDGMILAALLGSVRRDVKVMANYVLSRVPEMRDLFIFVDPFGGNDATAHNQNPMREAIRWLKSGGVLVAFPAGEVASLGIRAPKDRRAAME